MSHRFKKPRAAALRPPRYIYTCAEIAAELSRELPAKRLDTFLRTATNEMIQCFANGKEDDAERGKQMLLIVMALGGDNGAPVYDGPHSHEEQLLMCTAAGCITSARQRNCAGLG